MVLSGRADAGQSEEADDGRQGGVFLRGIVSDPYGLKETRRRELAAPRLRRAGHSLTT